MSDVMEATKNTFSDRRSGEFDPDPARRERRQFSDSHEEMSPDVRELAESIDSYKIRHRRRFITYEEMLSVVQSLGYHK